MVQNYGVDVILNDLSSNPWCEHGPSVLFERFLKNGKRVKYYACSACRDRKLCSFYCKADGRVENLSSKKTFLSLGHHYELFERYKDIVNLPPKERLFCQTCCSFLAASQKNKHSSCSQIMQISNEHLGVPTKILDARENSKYESQYLFSKDSVDVLVSLIRSIDCKKVLCIGSPRIHEAIKLKTPLKLKSFLLDVDKRFMSFFPPSEFQLYNLFNHHFFCGKEGRQMYEHFIKGREKLVLMLDPPFGGRMEMIARTLREIENDWRKVNSISMDHVLPVMLIFPYFLEKAVLENLPNFTMLDYKVDYDNHALYTTGLKGMKHGSPVRIFVNLSPNKFVLPSEGYHFCNLCQRWVYENNVHCSLCNGCVSKDGTTYKHCNICKRCVKPSWCHCEGCQQCQPQDHKCRDVEQIDANAGKCHICGLFGHKRRDCLKRKSSNTVENKRKRKKKNIFLSQKEEKKRNLDILNNIIKDKIKS